MCKEVIPVLLGDGKTALPNVKGVHPRVVG